MQGMRGLVDTMDVYGPARTGRYVLFLKLFPNYFKIQGSGAKIKVFKADPIAGERLTTDSQGRVFLR